MKTLLEPRSRLGTAHTVHVVQECSSVSCNVDVTNEEMFVRLGKTPAEVISDDTWHSKSKKVA